MMSRPCVRLAAALLFAFAPLAGAQVANGDRVTMNLDGASLADVLETFAVEYHMNVVAGADVTGTVTMNLFDVPAEEALQAVLQVNGYGFEKSGRFYLVRRLDDMNRPAPDALETAVVWLDYLSAEEALKLILPLKSTEGSFTAGTKAEVGLPSDATTAGGNSPAGGEVLVLKDRHSIVEDVKGVLRELDRRPRQVQVEATILEVKLTDDTSLGVDFNSLSGVNFTDLNGLSNLNSLALQPAKSKEIAKGFISGGTAGFASDANTDGLHLGVVTDSIAVFIEALERVTDATVLANPRLLVVDRQRAEIIIGAKLGYQTATTTETATVQQIEFLDTGTQLRFRPYIAGDGYVRLEIHPENSTGVVDPVSGLPSETTTEVTTNVIVKDGNTIAIGGLIGDQVETTTKQIPFLGSLPWVGALFRQTADKVSRREVIVLLTLHVVDPSKRDDEGTALADALASNRDLIVRESLPISRLQLAQPWIVRGERALDGGDAQQALCCADAALFYLPSDPRASRLRRRAVLMLGTEDDEIRALRALEGQR